MDSLDLRMNELLEHTKAWREESRIAYIQNNMAKEYARIQARTKAANDQEWERKYGRDRVKLNASSP